MDISILGQNIKKLRELKNMNAFTLSKKAKVGAATISDIESGKRKTLQGDTIEKIAKALGVTSNELLSLEEDFEYDVTNIEEALDIILDADDLQLDGVILNENEKYIISSNFKAAYDIIKKLRG